MSGVRFRSTRSVPRQPFFGSRRRRPGAGHVWPKPSEDRFVSAQVKWRSVVRIEPTKPHYAAETPCHTCMTETRSVASLSRSWVTIGTRSTIAVAAMSASSTSTRRLGRGDPRQVARRPERHRPRPTWQTGLAAGRRLRAETELPESNGQLPSSLAVVLPARQLASPALMFAAWFSK